MKRCPQCNRLESDDALGFCRVDGTPLVGDSADVDPAARTMMLGSGSLADEAETSRLTDVNTKVSNVRQSGPTTILPERLGAERTQALGKPKSLRVVMVSAFATLVIAAAAYTYYVTRKSNTAISSIAVMPFVNASGNADVEYLSDGMTETLISSLSQLQNLNGLNDKDQAFAWLNKAYDDRSFFIALLKVETTLDNLRPDPRFKELLRRANLQV